MKDIHKGILIGFGVAIVSLFALGTVVKYSITGKVF